ncbi:MAG TPA: hypothetical protein VIH82_08570, partial [Acidimicrobiia bacterium]
AAERAPAETERSVRGRGIPARSEATHGGASRSAASDAVEMGSESGWRRVLVVGAVAGIVLGGFGLAADTISGRWNAPDGSWADVLSFTKDSSHEGQFRILWIGDPDVLPLDPVELDSELSWVVTRNGAGDARELWRAPVTSADDVIARAIAVTRAGLTTRMGRLLAPAGVRYLVVPVRNGPDGTRGRRVPAVTAALAGQLDLTQLRGEPGLLIYENRAWAPARALTTSDVPSGSVAPLRSAVRTDLARARPVGDKPVAPGTLLLAEAYDGGWTADGGGRTLAHLRAFGWVNGWQHPNLSTVQFAHDGQGARYAALAGELILWLAVIAWWSRGRARARATQREHVRRERVERAPRATDFALDGELAGFDDLDGFWDQ